MTQRRVRTLGAGGTLPLLALAVAGCGGGSSPHGSSTVAASGSSTTTAAPHRAPVVPRLRVRSPRRGARVTPTVGVTVSLSGARARGPRAFRYVLDGAPARFGPAHLVFHGLAAGRHRLLVALSARRGVTGVVTFTVVAPPPPPAPLTSTTSTVPSATLTTPAPAPPPPTTTSTTAPPTATTTTPAPTGGIPQGPSAGDADADNHGGPSDGDGNV